MIQWLNSWKTVSFGENNLTNFMYAGGGIRMGSRIFVKFCLTLQSKLKHCRWESTHVQKPETVATFNRDTFFHYWTAMTFIWVYFLA